MRRRLDVTPQARRDVAAILEWYRQNLGAKSALKVAKTLRLRTAALAAGRVRGVETAPSSQCKRAAAKKHVIIFSIEADAIRIARIVHGAQDLEAIVESLDDGAPDESA